MEEKNKFTLNAVMNKYDNTVNEGFAKVKILVDTHEQVANGTKFTKGLLESKMGKLNYLPIIAEFKEENKDFGTHGGKIELSDEGIEWIDTTRPYGVVIENSGRFEDVKKMNGDTISYVVCDGYVWVDRYPELNVLFEGKPNNQSMEIHVLAGHYGEDDVYHIDDFEYSALCILGKDITPAFDLAKVEANFEAKDFKVQYEEMLSALEKYLTNDTSQKEEEIKETKEEFKEEEIKEEANKEEFDYEELYKEKSDNYDVLQVKLNSVLEDFENLTEKFENLTQDFEEYKSTHSIDNEEVERLQQFEIDTLTEKQEQEVEKIFAQFKDLEGVEEFESLKQKASEFTLEQLEKEVAFILVKNNTNFKFTAKPNTKKDKVKIGLSLKNDEKVGKYDGLFEKYSKQK